MSTYYLHLYPTQEGLRYYSNLCPENNIFAKSDSEDIDYYVPNPDNAGIDLYCAKTQTIEPGNVTLLDLGVKAVLRSKNGRPVHYWLAPRSSIWKSGVTMANSMGIIDRSYRGVLMGAVLPYKNESVTIEAGTRLFQLVAPDMGTIERIYLHDISEIDTTSRGSGGFGSTGK
jgi:dUTP pyrophosphatase